MSVRRAQSEIDSAEFSEWIAYSRIDPFLIHREENMLAVICSILVNTNRKKGTKAFGPEYFLPHYDASEKQPESAVEMEAKLKAMFNGDNK